MKRSKATGDNTGKEFELIDENTLLWEENKKLKIIVKAHKSQWSGSENRSFNLGFD